MTVATPRNDAVVSHFRRVSNEWGDRYGRQARRMSDLDLQLRRENALGLLVPVLQAATERLFLLDVGCGSGNFLETLPPDGIVLHGADVVPEMVAAAKCRVPEANLRPAEAAALPWASASMDVVTSLGVLEYLDRPALALAEMHRVLKPGGTLIVSFPNRQSLFRRLSRWETAVEHAASGALKRLRGKSPSGPSRPSYVHRARSTGEARRLIETAGFRIEEARCNTYGLWGRLGRNRAALRLSQSLSRRLPTPSIPARFLACTLVFRARKPQPGKGPAR